jgi:exopolyphosphatase/guanosine-5'-triphosphate,3'-diphosphate pyrophosphatase
MSLAVLPKVPNLKLALIDLGTNSLRFDIYRVGEGESPVRLHREKMMVRLGEEVFLTGQLTRGAQMRTLQAMRRFRTLADRFGVNRVVAFGTCTLREAGNSPQFLEEIRTQTGITVQVISGEQEAKLIALGVLSLDPRAIGKVALVDIGGGSTEITVCEARQILHSSSFELGTARLQQLFFHRGGSPVGPYRLSSVRALREHIRSAVLAKFVREEWPKVNLVLGSSGTIRMLADVAFEATGKKSFRRSFLRKLIARMSLMSVPQIKAIPGMSDKRADMAMVGAVLLEECAVALGAKQIVPSRFALRDGMLIDQIRRIWAENRLDATLEVFPLFEKACRLGCRESDLKLLVANAERLFTGLQKLHGLPARWRDLLLMAVIFRDTGWVVSPIDYEEHSYYIVKHAELPVTAPWETEFVAQLCLLHDQVKFEVPSFSKSDRPKESRRAFLILHALMQILNALDPVHQEKVLLSEARVTAARIHLIVSSGIGADLARIRLEPRRPRIEKVLGKGLLLGSAEPESADRVDKFLS